MRKKRRTKLRSIGLAREGAHVDIYISDFLQQARHGVGFARRCSPQMVRI